MVLKEASDRSQYPIYEPFLEFMTGSSANQLTRHVLLNLSD
ncbi:hypothetical protein [Oculatella sp. FACHB-28]|nr:hypothetical protein [Oculatella sp. FACHB-28]